MASESKKMLKDRFAIAPNNPLFLGFLVFLLMVSISSNAKVLPFIGKLGQTSGVALLREPRLGDGCYHVFLDVGANIGVNGRFLYEPERYRKSWCTVPLFAEKFGTDRSNEDYCVFAVEANPHHWTRLDEVADAYAAMGWRYHVIRAAAGDADGTMTFYHQGDNHNGELGFSVKQRDLSWGKESLKSSVEVPTIQLAHWIKREILERRIPDAAPSGRQYKKPIIGMKFDIEGAEYIVLPDLIFSGVYCELDYLQGEMHLDYTPISFEGHKVPLETKQDAMNFYRSLKLMLKSTRNCKTPMKWCDDEQHSKDGKSFPKPALIS